MMKKKRNKRQVNPNALNAYPFSLIEDLTGKFALPTGPFDPNGPWKLTYRIHATFRTMSHAGNVTLTKRKNGNVEFQIALERLLKDGMVHRSDAMMECCADSINTPTHWTLRSRNVLSSGEEGDATRVDKEGFTDGKSITLLTNERARQQIAFSGMLTSEWGLFDAVQRLPEDSRNALRFNLLDDFDRIKPEQELIYVGPETLWVIEPGQRLELGVRPEPRAKIEVDVFQQTGRGISPTFYWRDKRGLVLFVGAGLEAYLLEAVEI